MPKKKITKKLVKTSSSSLQKKVEAPIIKNEHPKLISKTYIYAIGRRKTSIARVRLTKNGNGTIKINNKEPHIYMPYFEYQDIILSPLKVTGTIHAYDFSIKVHGGGSRGQAEAIRHGISRALIKLDNNLRKTLKPLGYLKRDPRMKERKKPGLKRARRAPQWQKR